VAVGGSDLSLAILKIQNKPLFAGGGNIDEEEIKHSTWWNAFVNAKYGPWISTNCSP